MTIALSSVGVMSPDARSVRSLAESPPLGCEAVAALYLDRSSPFQAFVDFVDGRGPEPVDASEAVAEFRRDPALVRAFLDELQLAESDL